MPSSIVSRLSQISISSQGTVTSRKRNYYHHRRVSSRFAAAAATGEKNNEEKKVCVWGSLQISQKLIITRFLQRCFTRCNFSKNQHGTKLARMKIGAIHWSVQLKLKKSCAREQSYVVARGTVKGMRYHIFWYSQIAPKF